jgi:hypothetical protein
MEVGIESKKITKRLYGNSGAGHSILLRCGLLEKLLQRFPATSAQLRKEFSVEEKISAEDFGYAEDEMAVRDCLDHFLAQPFSEFNDPLLMAGPPWRD